MTSLRRGFRALPGPLPIRIIESAIIVIVLLIALHFFYTWLGTTYLDPGGAIT